MTYCIDFFRKFKKEGNFCGLDKSQVSRLMAYLEIVEALVKQKIPEEQIYENFTVKAAEPLISAKGEAHTDGLNYVAATLKDGKQVTEKDLKSTLKSCINATISGGSATVKPKKREPYNGTPQKPPTAQVKAPLPVEKPVVKESLTVPPAAPIAQTLKEKYGGDTFAKSEQPATVKESLTVQPAPEFPWHCGVAPCPDGKNYISIDKIRGKVCNLFGDIGLPCDQLAKERCPVLIRINKAKEGGVVPASDIDSLTGGRFVKLAPVKITKAPMTISFQPSQKQQGFIERLVASGEFETPVEFIGFLVDGAMEQEGGA